MEVDVALREGDAGALSVEGHFGGAGQIPVDVPVVGRFRPRAADEVDGRVGELVDSHDRLRIFEDGARDEAVDSSWVGCW